MMRIAVAKLREGGNMGNSIVKLSIQKENKRGEVNPLFEISAYKPINQIFEKNIRQCAN